MAWWRPNEVRVTHIPTGHTARAEKMSPASMFKLRGRAMAMLRSKIAAPVEYGPMDIRRCYTVPDGAWTTAELDGAVHIHRMSGKVAGETPPVAYE